MADMERLFRLNPTVQFDEVGDGFVAKVLRGEAVTRYTINRTIVEFLEMFREPVSMSEVADRLAQSGMDREQVLSFGEGIARTPLIEHYDAGDGKSAVLEDFLASRGLRLEHCYKDRKLDGVYRVMTASGERRILKLVHSCDGSADTASVIRRLRNECVILRSLLDLEGVARVDEFEFDAVPYFTMPLLPGVPLLDRKRTGLKSALKLCAQVANLVGSIHQAGIVHGDIHTSNFLRDDSDCLSIIDFDCSFRPDEDYIPRIGGAIHFLPPERVVKTWHDRSMVAPNYSSDIYQAAVVMYALLTDDLPYRGATLSELSANIRTGAFRPLEKTACAEPIPSIVLDYIHSSLAKDPSARPRTTMDFPDDAT